MKNPNDRSRNRKIKLGTTYEVRTFAAVDVHMKAIRWYSDEIRSYCESCLIRKEDLKTLKKAGVPYSEDEDPLDCKGVMYNWQILRVVNEKRKKKRSKKRRKSPKVKV